MSTTPFQRALFNLMTVSILLYLFLPAAILNALYSYSSPGGALIMKIHPGTYLIVLGFCWLLGRCGCIRLVVQNASAQLWVLQFALVMLFVAFVNVLRFGPAGAAYMVDTLIAAPLALVLLAYLAPQQRHQLTSLILMGLLINSVVAIGEMLLRKNLIPHQNEIGAAYFRASAFFGHPLTGGLMTASVLPLLLLTTWKIGRKAGFVTLYIVAILAFGARGALIAGVSVFSASLLLEMASMLFRKRLPLSLFMLVPWAVIFGSVGLVFLIVGTGFGARIMERGIYDDNASVRVHSFDLLSRLTDEQLWTGIDGAYYQLLLDKYRDVTIIENFWVNLLVAFGIPMFALFAVSFFWFLYGLQKSQSGLMSCAVLSFLVVASTNNSLSTKSAALTVFSVAVYGFRKHPVSPREARPEYYGPFNNKAYRHG